MVLFRVVTAVWLCGVLLADPVIRPTSAGFLVPNRTAPTSSELFIGSAVSYIAGGAGTMAIALLAFAYGWTVPLFASFAVGGAACAVLIPNESVYAYRVPMGIRAMAGAARGLMFFPAIIAVAGKNVYGPVVARWIHAVR